jgi:hypothetical protein
VSSELTAAVHQLTAVVGRLCDLLSGPEVTRRVRAPSTEEGAILWLLQQVAETGATPSLSEASRQIGVDRRTLRADKWSEFREAYDRLVSLEENIRKVRAATMLSARE